MKLRHIKLNVEFPEDVTRIVRVLAERGVNVTDEQAHAAWLTLSDEYMAGWLAPHANDDELFNAVRKHIN